MVSRQKAISLSKKVTHLAALRMSRETVTKEELLNTVRVAVEAMQILVEYGVESKEHATCNP